MWSILFVASIAVIAIVVGRHAGLQERFGRRFLAIVLAAIAMFGVLLLSLSSGRPSFAEVIQAALFTLLGTGVIAVLLYLRRNRA
jgi:hypothetical protein